MYQYVCRAEPPSQFYVRSRVCIDLHLSTEEGKLHAPTSCFQTMHESRFQVHPSTRMAGTKSLLEDEHCSLRVSCNPVSSG